MIIKFDFT